jgi:hypothetical protein
MLVKALDVYALVVNAFFQIGLFVKMLKQEIDIREKPSGRYTGRVAKYPLLFLLTLP